MPETTTTDVQTEATAPAGQGSSDEALVEECLVEEVSIDGMCGVY